MVCVKIRKMFDVILAMTRNYGIGYEGKLPWHCPEELKIFKEKTKDSVLIMGRKTVETLPHLPGRTIICLTRGYKPRNYKNKVFVFSSLDKALRSCLCVGCKVFVAGGSEIYKEVFRNFRHKIERVHLSVMKEEVKCDKFVEFDWKKWVINEKEILLPRFNHYVLRPYVTDEWEYLETVRDVFNNGVVRVGRNGETKSMFGKTLRFNLTKGFPLLTTKKMFFRGVFEELLFFIRGETDSKKLEEKKVNIWKGNTSREFLDSIDKKDRPIGLMGEMYGYQWRNFNAPYDEKTGKPLEKGLDQLRDVVDKIRNDPMSRRILMTTYNPLQAKGGVLYPCHSLVLQFYVDGEYLDMFCYNRSSDLFHGLPFNIASSSLLLYFIAKITSYIPRNFILSLGDAHIYKSHYDVVEKQLRRQPYEFPSIMLKRELLTVEDVENLRYDDLDVIGYKSHGSIKVDMVV